MQQKKCKCEHISVFSILSKHLQSAQASPVMTELKNIGCLLLRYTTLLQAMLIKWWKTINKHAGGIFDYLSRDILDISISASIIFLILIAFSMHKRSNNCTGIYFFCDSTLYKWRHFIYSLPPRSAALLAVSSMIYRAITLITHAMRPTNLERSWCRF